MRAIICAAHQGNGVLRVDRERFFGVAIALLQALLFETEIGQCRQSERIFRISGNESSECFIRVVETANGDQAIGQFQGCLR